MAALSAAAALVLLVVGLVPVLRHLGGSSAGGASGTATMSRQEGGPAAAPSATAQLPEFAAPAGYSASALRTGVAADPAIRSAYARAGGGPGSTGQSAGRGPAAAPETAAGSADLNSRSPGKGATTVDQQACLARVRAVASGEVRPAFFVETVYRGRPATVLVTRRAGAADQAELWAFPRDDCSVAPFASEQVKVPPP